jgi:hypothetical protein
MNSFVRVRLTNGGNVRGKLQQMQPVVVRTHHFY